MNIKLLHTHITHLAPNSLSSIVSLVCVCVWLQKKRTDKRKNHATTHNVLELSLTTTKKIAYFISWRKWLTTQYKGEYFWYDTHVASDYKRHSSVRKRKTSKDISEFYLMLLWFCSHFVDKSKLIYYYFYILVIRKESSNLAVYSTSALLPLPSPST